MCSKSLPKKTQDNHFNTDESDDEPIRHLGHLLVPEILEVSPYHTDGLSSPIPKRARNEDMKPTTGQATIIQAVMGTILMVMASVIMGMVLIQVGIWMMMMMVIQILQIQMMIMTVYLILLMII